MGTVIYEKHYPKWSAKDQKKLQKNARAGSSARNQNERETEASVGCGGAGIC